MTQLIVPGNADPTKVLSGSTFSAGTNYNAAGTMPNKVGSGTILSPGNADIAIPQGYFGGAVGDGKVKGDSNLLAANILSGKSIFGVAGSVIAGKRTASGSTSIVTDGTSKQYINVTGLAFRPSKVLVIVHGTSDYLFTAYVKDASYCAETYFSGGIYSVNGSSFPLTSYFGPYANNTVFNATDFTKLISSGNILSSVSSVDWLAIE